jgi:multiple sugar transport system permease protein
MARAGGHARLRLKDFSGYAFVAPYLVLFSAFLLLPLAYGLVLSLMRWEMLSPAPAHFIGLANYVEALGSAYFHKALWATFRFVAMAVPLTVAGALVAALGIHATGHHGLYRAAYFLPTLISISVAGILWRWFFNGEFGLFNAYLGVVGVKVPWLTDQRWAMKSIALMTLWWTLGGPMVVLLAGLHHIPQHYYEAASLDGANALQRFRHVTLPQLRPVLLFVMVMNIIGGFQVFGQVFMVTRGGPEFSTRVLVQYIYETAFMNYRMGYGAAMSWLLFAAIALFSFAQFRVMRER